MSYKIAQYTNLGINSNYNPYYQTILTKRNDENTPSAIIKDGTSYTISLQNNELNNLNDNYYLKFTLVPPSSNNLSTNTCTIKLLNNGESESNIQQLVKFNVPNDQTNLYIPIHLKKQYSIIQWNFDYVSNGTDNIQDCTIYKINDISLLSSNIIKIGIQGPPHMPVWLNHECIHLNGNGIYELDNNIRITSVGVFPPLLENNNQYHFDFFLINYMYQDVTS